MLDSVAQALAGRPRGSNRVVSYTTFGSLLVVGEGREALRAASRFAELMDVVIVGVQLPKEERRPRYRRIEARVTRLEGHLGRYSGVFERGGIRSPLSQISPRPDGYFDFVLDLSEKPLIDAEVPPLGYLRPGEWEQGLAGGVAPRGETHKPIYVDFSAQRCAHRRGELVGCERCIEVCPADAITPGDAHIDFDPYRCRGCGDCTARCPTGALQYIHDPPQSILEHCLQALDTLRGGPAKAPCLVFDPTHREESTAPMTAGATPILRIPVHSVAALPLGAWLMLLAAGAAAVALVVPAETPPKTRRLLQESVQQAHAILHRFGLPAGMVQLLEAGTAPQSVAGSTGLLAPSGRPDPAAPTGREFLREALAQLAESTGIAPEPFPLPSAYGLGTVQVDRSRCTSCHACVGACPQGALSVAGAAGELRFREFDCIQCGLCVQSCPEAAIRMEPRAAAGLTRASASIVLQAADMVRCARCGEAFMPRALLERVQERLQACGHHRSVDADVLAVCPRCRADAALKEQIRARC